MLGARGRGTWGGVIVRERERKRERKREELGE